MGTATAMHTQILPSILASAVMAFSAALAHPVFAAVVPDHKEAGNLTVYVGTLPAPLMRKHPSEHVERTMHGGPPVGSNEYHLVVAIFDTASGTRISDADVSATVSDLGHVSANQLKLEPMTINNAVTYGGFVALPARERATISIQVRRSGEPSPVQAEFLYEPEAS